MAKKVSKVIEAIPPLEMMEKVKKMQTHWDTKEAFVAALAASGVNPDTIDVNSEWDLYNKDKEGYRNASQ